MTAERLHPVLDARVRAIFPSASVRALVRTTSTQEVVRAAARSGAPPGYCVVADEQSAGRGRQGRSWSAPAGSSLLFSVLLRPAAATGVLPLAAGVAVADAIQACCGLAVALKWPNDVLASGGKLAGILAEVEPLAPASGGGPAVALGVGVNLSVDTFPEGVAGVSLHRLVGADRLPGRDQLLSEILVDLGSRLEQVDGGEAGRVLDDWRRRAIGLGQRIEAVEPGGTVEGTAVDVDGEGALVVELEDGTRRRLLAADVHLGRGVP